MNADPCLAMPSVLPRKGHPGTRGAKHISLSIVDTIETAFLTKIATTAARIKAQINMRAPSLRASAVAHSCFLQSEKLF